MSGSISVGIAIDGLPRRVFFALSAARIKTKAGRWWKPERTGS
jgi:hypothetical protein